MDWKLLRWFVCLNALAAFAAFAQQPAPQQFQFVILGDRTGETQSGVYEQVWEQVAAQQPAFVISAGDTIQGLNDATAESEWRQVQKIHASYSRFPLYLTPGNHDIWSDLSERLFRKYTGHAPHYSFDYRQAHFTVLDNSRSEDLAPGELAFLESDLRAHATQQVKMIVSHRPSWLLDAVFQKTGSPLHQLARKYGVRYVIAGHVHQMIRVELDGVTYLSMPSSGGHLRASKKYEDGWFFGYTMVNVRGQNISLQISELPPPNGRGRSSKPEDWGMSGLARLRADGETRRQGGASIFH